MKKYKVDSVYLVDSDGNAKRCQNLSAIQETQVQSLDQDHPLEKGMATHSSTLAWRIPWTEQSGGFHGVAESDMAETIQHTHIQILFHVLFHYDLLQNIE